MRTGGELRILFSFISSLLAGADTALLREAWQRAMRAEERSNEALLEAWSATVTSSERLEVATKESGWQRGRVGQVGEIPTAKLFVCTNHAKIGLEHGLHRARTV